MTDATWLLAEIGEERRQNALVDASRYRLAKAFDSPTRRVGSSNTLTIADYLEIQMFELLDDEDHNEDLRAIAEETFQIARAQPRLDNPLDELLRLVRLGCIASLGDRAADFRRIVREYHTPSTLIESQDWGLRVWSTVLDTWLRLLRKNGWSDFDSVLQNIVAIREDQQEFESAYLGDAEERNDVLPAWELMYCYHLAKAGEDLGSFLSCGSIDGHYDVREQLEAQFDRALNVARRGRLMEKEIMTRLLARTARVLVGNSTWTVVRAVNSKVHKFANLLMSRDNQSPIFEMLPPQRRTLREHGLLGSSSRAVVVSLPTSSGKTLISEFRILQALNQFDEENGWVAYLAPTRALVNQLVIRLRRDFSGLGVVVEKVSPALEVDGLEEEMLLERDGSSQFRILVTTPEKLDLMLRGGWEERIGRPLTLVVVDEAHNLASGSRGIKLELLLSTINRECFYAQFLLLTPFLRKGDEVAKWLSPESNKHIDIGVDWTPNDRIVAIVQPTPGEKKGDFSLSLRTCHTSRNTLHVPEVFTLGEVRPLRLSRSKVTGNQGKLAAATAEVLRDRGTVIVLAKAPSFTWSIADSFVIGSDKRAVIDDDTRYIQKYLTDEMGEDYPLAKLLTYGVGVHHRGMSEDSRTLMEWLAENNKLDVLIATTTIAQGVNFPVSGIVFASHQYSSSTPPYHPVMPAQDFWNIAGRAGRVDQSELGVIALVADSDERCHTLKKFVNTAVGELNSTLIEMIGSLESEEEILNLERISHQPKWSAFVQYLTHTYRQMDNHEMFAMQVEQVLRGTLGFQEIRKSHQGWADNLVKGVQRYAERLKGKPLALVDATGFSWESVGNTLARLEEEKLPDDVWTTELFSSNRGYLRKMMGLLLQIPELRESLKEVTGGSDKDGSRLTCIVCDWVQGRSLADMAVEYFSRSYKSSGKEHIKSPTDAMTQCCQTVFGRLTQTASWGLAALQSLTMQSRFDELPDVEKRVIRNLPAKVYYGVNTDNAVTLRLLGIPRSAAQCLANELGINFGSPLHRVRNQLHQKEVGDWVKAMGESGTAYHRVWSILEGKM